MTIELTDETGEATRPDGEPLWRGVTMLRYDDGRWHRQTKGAQAIVSFKEDPRRKNGKLICQKIKLEPIDSPTLFGIRPILDASSLQKIQPALSNNDATLFRPDVLNDEYDYVVISDRDVDGAQPHEAAPADDDKAFLSMPMGLRNRLKAIAEPLIVGIDPKGPEGIAARSRSS